jgi:hypothetical protein
MEQRTETAERALKRAYRRTVGVTTTTIELRRSQHSEVSPRLEGHTRRSRGRLGRSRVANSEKPEICKGEYEERDLVEFRGSEIVDLTWVCPWAKNVRVGSRERSGGLMAANHEHT